MAKQTKRKSPTPEGLEEYRAKRDFGATPEPTPGQACTDGGRFVIQEHSATRLHWDLRLEHDGVAVSWAVPNGIPEVPGENRMAVHTEDHPLEYLEWEGVIPKGNYGAGTMKLWDRGTYECHEWTSDKVTATFHGERVQGRYHLFETSGNNWMIRRVDPPLDPDREPIPAHAVPVTPAAGFLPADDARHAYEVMWDGLRTIAFCEPGRLRLDNGAGGDLSDRFPDVRRLTRDIGAHSAVLDGELVAFGADGKPDPARLERRLKPGSDSTMRARAREAPVVYEIYDLLYLDGRSLTALPWEERRERLRDLEIGGENWRVSQHHEGDGGPLLDAARANGLPGIVAKPLGSPYGPDAAWVAVHSSSVFTREEVDAYYRAVAPVIPAHLKLTTKAFSKRVADGAIEFRAQHAASMAFEVETTDGALLLHGMFDQLGLESFAKSNGAGGLQVYVPLNGHASYEQTQAFAHQVAELLAERADGLRVDTSLNDRGRTTLCAYSLREGEPPSVAAPITWGEVESGDVDHGPDAVIERVAEHGDLFAPVLSLVQELPG